MTDSLQASYAYCHGVARRAAGNFYYSFLVLPPAKRRAMCALYAFLRETDDLGDSAQPADVRRSELIAWQGSLRDALAGHPTGPILPALVDIVVRYGIPHEYLYDAIDGMMMDLGDCCYATFADLEAYCYKVASVVGLSCIHIWGFHDPTALEPARQLGVALQLTNILRDLQEDAQRGRVYLPQEDLQRFGYSTAELLAGEQNERFQSLMQFEIARAEDLYRRGAALEPLITADSQAALRAMTGIYHALLEEIKRRNGDVYSQRVRLSPWRKSWIALCALIARPAWIAAALRPEGRAR